MIPITGTCAKIAMIYEQGELKVGETFVNESITGTTFKGRIIEETKVGEHNAIVVKITGSAYIIGFNHLVIDEEDPEVEVVTVSTGDKNRLVIEKNKGSMSREEIEERLNALKDIKFHPRDKMENRLLLAKGERLYQEPLGDKRELIGDSRDRSYRRDISNKKGIC
ncbi:proline racemase family protein [Clostridium bowmanii]|uniref:proline racemase family protein n=1 Tax=Clostridium bowmanii TaxID=132925 RepID=UPI0035E40A4E